MSKHTPLPSAPPPVLGGGLLDIANVCTALNVSRATVYRLLKAGHFPAGVRVGARLRWSRAEIENYVGGKVA